MGMKVIDQVDHVFFLGVSSKTTGERDTHVHHPHSPEPHNYHHPPEKLYGASHHHSSSAATDFDSDIGFDLSSLEDDDDDDDSDDELSREDSLENFGKTSHEEQQLLSDQTEDEKGHCVHDKKVYKSGESWTVQSDCSECFCEQGLVSCKPISCNVPEECRLARAQPLSCCPVCDGKLRIKKISFHLVSTCV